MPAPDSSDKTALPSPGDPSPLASSGPDTPEDGSGNHAHVDIPESGGQTPDEANPLVEDEQNGDTGESVVPIDLRPPGLEISQAEIEFLARLGGLVPTPRAAKRMVNIYRLVRIGVPDEDLPAFTGDEKGGPYQAVQVLLAILTGSPAVAGDVFQALLEAPPADNVLNVLQEMRSRTDLQEPLNRIENEISVLAIEAGFSLTAADCQRWCPVLARFSFRTRELAGISARPASGIPQVASS
jgi:hypothetical protein